MNAPLPVEVKQAAALAAITEQELCTVLQSSLYPGAKIESIKLVLGYCKAAGLDPMQKPVHIVPMSVSTGKKDSDGWDIKEMRDVVMPGIGLYRIQAARSGQYAGVSEPEFGTEATETLDGVSITFPIWCRVTVRRLLGSQIVEFSAVERWKENYATKSNKSAAPNAMWKRRPFAQLAKCSEAQALRKAFPEIGAQPTADEMEGKPLDGYEVDVVPASVATRPAVEMPRSTSDKPPVRDAEIIDKDTGEIGKTAGGTKHAGDQSTPPAQNGEPAGDTEVTPKNALAPGQLKVIKAKLTHAALSDVDFVAKWGKPLTDADGFPNFRATQANDLLAWINEKAGG
jgi:phage recombination protein Bet